MKRTISALGILLMVGCSGKLPSSPSAVEGPKPVGTTPTIAVSCVSVALEWLIDRSLEKPRVRVRSIPASTAIHFDGAPIVTNKDGWAETKEGWHTLSGVVSGCRSLDHSFQVVLNPNASGDAPAPPVPPTVPPVDPPKPPQECKKPDFFSKHHPPKPCEEPKDEPKSPRER